MACLEGFVFGLPSIVSIRIIVQMIKLQSKKHTVWVDGWMDGAAVGQSGGARFPVGRWVILIRWAPASHRRLDAVCAQTAKWVGLGLEGKKQQLFNTRVVIGDFQPSITLRYQSIG